MYRVTFSTVWTPKLTQTETVDYKTLKSMRESLVYLVISATKIA